MIPDCFYPASEEARPPVRIKKFPLATPTSFDKTLSVIGDNICDMTIDQNRIKYLLAQYAAGSCTDIEQQELMALLEDRSAEDIVLAGIDNWMKDNTIRHTMSAEDAHKTLQAILSREPARVEPINKHRIIRSPGTLWLRYAAAIILIFGIGAYLYNLTTKNHSETASIKPVPTEKDIAPGKDGAILTLADGRQIVLDSLHNGIIAEQTGTNIVLENGKLEYTTGSTPNSNKTLWNTMSTPRGRQFQVILPDGTKVWLNTASSLKYPTVFQGSTRIVEINGEAYFDVAGNKQMPFIVKINGGVEVQVLGTEFNINAYYDEPFVKTTLVEGKIKVSKQNGSNILQPGEQAVIKESISVRKNINIDRAVAWKNGVFNFEDAPFDEFMRQLARWYDLNIIYKSKVPDQRFRGELGRNLPLSEILDVLSIYHIPYSLNGKTLTIE